MGANDTPNDRPLGLRKREITAIAQGWPPRLTVGQAAELAGVPVGTIYDWSSAGYNLEPLFAAEFEDQPLARVRWGLFSGAVVA